MGVALILSSCSSDSSDSSGDTDGRASAATAAETTAAEAPAGDDATDGEETGDDEGPAVATAGDGIVVPLGETIEDVDMGDTIEVVSVVRDFNSPGQADLVADGGEVVLVEVVVNTGTEFGGLVSAGNFRISWDEGADFWRNKTRMVEDDMEAAGYTPFDDVSRRDGEGSGWMAFLVEERAETYLMEYSRSGAKVIGSDDTIDEFTTEFEIPGA